ncbi:MAG: retention module-containing protein, partial [Marinobacter sp.]|nr:retention module-containing protein [Marinobacter sp.]
MTSAHIEVQSIEGSLSLVNTSGLVRMLAAGEALEINEAGWQLSTPVDSLAVVLINGVEFTLGAESVLAIPAVADGLGPDETSQFLANETVEALIGALESDQDLLDLVEEPAAGIDGGSDAEGHGFVRLLRVVEDIAPAALSDVAITSATSDQILGASAGGLVVPTVLDAVESALSVNASVDNDAATVSVSGETTDVAEGTVVAIT